MSPSDPKGLRFRFGEYVLSPSRRLLLCSGEPVPLIPRYFDLLMLLIERRNEAVPRSEILDEVWHDVVVSDGALNQAVRVLRRALGDDPKSPRFIRTVARHGYRFIYDDIVEEADDATLPEDDMARAAGSQLTRDQRFDRALRSLLDPQAGENDRREAAEILHTLGTDRALRRLGGGPHDAIARAFLRDSRWDVPGAGSVPILGQPRSATTTMHLIRLRVRRAVGIVWGRWLSAVGGGAVAGLIGGLLGGVALRFGPGAAEVDSLLVTVPILGAIVGALAASGVAAGLAGAEAVVRSMRGPAVVLGGALGGGLIGAVVHLMGRLTLQILFGRDLSAVVGGFEGLVIGGAVGLGYALATPTVEGGMATPKAGARLLAAGLSGATAAAAAVVLAATGSHLGATSLDFISRVFPGSDVGLQPMLRLFGEQEPGAVTRMVVSGLEGLLFGFWVVLGLTRRPR